LKLQTPSRLRDTQYLLCAGINECGGSKRHEYQPHIRSRLATQGSILCVIEGHERNIKEEEG
jgi:hypothetical protein